MTVIIDYDMGNVGSIKNMLKRLGYDAIVTSDIEIIKNATKIILPGVGAFDVGMENLKNRGLIDLLNNKVLVEKTPILGICLGMQLMTLRSEEGKLKGLEWIEAETIKFRLKDIKIPHMGWNDVRVEKESIIFPTLGEYNRFYFVHSYYVNCFDKTNIVTTTEYGERFVSSFVKENIFGVQFHPEKSHSYGFRLLKYFMER